MSAKKQVLASDWDDVMYSFLKFWLPMYNEIKGTAFAAEQIHAHDLSLVLGDEVEDIMDLIDKFHDEVESLDHGLLPSVEDVIPALAKDYDIIIITARKKRFEYRIKEFVDHYLPGSISGVYLLEDYHDNGHDKGSFIKELDAVALVDDHIKNVESAIDNGLKGFLMSMPKNSHYTGRAERVRNWYEIYEKLTGRPFLIQHSGRQEAARNR